MMKSVLREFRHIVRSRRVEGRSPARAVPLPPGDYRMGGTHFEDDAALVAAAVEDVRRLEEFGMQRSSSLYDLGCGAGRLAIGLQESWGYIEYYLGVDVQKAFVRWTRRHLGGPHFDFVHIDHANDRYNPQGSDIKALPGKTQSFDVFHAYSVFSHLNSSDVRAYLREVRRLLRPDGFGFFTAFVEWDVEDEVENPTGYGPFDWEGPLHCVRYEMGFLQSLIEEAGLVPEHCSYGTETDGQSLFVVTSR